MPRVLFKCHAARAKRGLNCQGASLIPKFQNTLTGKRTESSSVEHSIHCYQPVKHECHPTTLVIFHPLPTSRICLLHTETRRLAPLLRRRHDSPPHNWLQRRSTCNASQDSDGGVQHTNLVSVAADRRLLVRMPSNQVRSHQCIPCQPAQRDSSRTG